MMGRKRETWSHTDDDAVFVSGRLKELCVCIATKFLSRDKKYMFQNLLNAFAGQRGLGDLHCSTGTILHPELRAQRADTDSPKLLPTLHLNLHQYDPEGKYKCFALA